jgi:hypothetical protein
MKKSSIIRIATALAGVAAIAGLPQSTLAQSLISRWTFNETSGTTANNSVSGGPNATLMGGAAFDGSGKAVLDGTAGTYVNLGSGSLSGLTSATFTGWFSYSVPNNNVHLFSFDDGSGTGSGGTYLRYNIYDTGNGHGGTNFVESIQGWGGNTLHGGQVLPQNQDVFVAVTYDPANNTESIYFNGQLASTYSGSLVSLSAFASFAGTLGRSPWVAYGDPNLVGTIDEFSIYNGALSDAQVLADFQAGPTTVPEPSVFALSGLAILAILRRRNAR